MAIPSFAPTTTDLIADRATETARAPWPIYAVLFASTSVVLGVIWDISWHRTIGRDTFWTPAHLAIYLGGVVAGLTCGWLALHTTFAGSTEDRAAAVRFWGFRAPFGAWVCIWGTFAMLTSAPFDDWWHNAYGLDVKIISPPHMLLAAGIGAIQCGAMLMALAWQNRADRQSSPARQPVSAWRRTARPARGNGGHRVHPALGHAPVVVLPGHRGGVRVLPGEHGARIDRAMAGDDHRALVHGADDGDAAGVAAVSRPAAARTDLRAGRSIHAAGLSVAAGRAGARDRLDHATGRAAVARATGASRS